jgi:hypothetical protein
MKSLSITVIILEIVALFLFLALLSCFLNDQLRTSESFQDSYCDAYDTCTTCANASGCTWCPKAKKCLIRTALKSTDPKCNPMNTVSSSFLCKGAMGEEGQGQGQEATSTPFHGDKELYEQQIADKIPPPMVWMTEKAEYSPETVMAELRHAQEKWEMDQKRLPGLIVDAVQPIVQPMVRGTLKGL